MSTEAFDEYRVISGRADTFSDAKPKAKISLFDHNLAKVIRNVNHRGADRQVDGDFVEHFILNFVINIDSW